MIQAGSEPISQYTYRFDTNTANVDVLRGGRAGPIYDAGDGLYAVDISFNRLLEPGQTASLEYFTTFHYVEPPPLEFRRVAIRRIDSLELRVQFNPERLPSCLQWATWARLDGAARPEDELELDSDYAAHRYVGGLQAGIVGFVWAW